jgi:hypothetical protein
MLTPSRLSRGQHIAKALGVGVSTVLQVREATR